ncbi:MAG: OsmC family protein [Methylobacteriaceae bacterium]|nr:OsmC family protein [Methylobacteriaceae bacterium]
MRTERFTFPGSQGAALAARLDLPDGPPVAVALFAHCFACGKDVLAASRISAALVARGFGVLRFDFTGLGASEGEFANTDFSSNLQDLVRAAAALRERGHAPSLLVGHSLGGAAVLAAAQDLPEVRAVVTIGAPFDPAHVLHQLGESVERIEAEGEAEVRLGGRPFRIRRRFLEDVRGQTQRERIAALHIPLLVLHAPGDAIVGIDQARAIFEAARHPKSFVSLDDADHLLTRAEDAAFVADLIAAWSGRYLGARARPAPAPAAAPGDAAVTVRETRRGLFQQEVRAGRHVFTADEPVAMGGLDSGPGPYDLLLAALGACTAMTMRLYAERKGLALGAVTVELDHDRIHASDCASCETQDGMVDRIRRRIRLTGDLAPAERARLREIADRCPVHRTLHSEIVVETAELAGPAPA